MLFYSVSSGLFLLFDLIFEEDIHEFILITEIRVTDYLFKVFNLTDMIL